MLSESSWKVGCTSCGPIYCVLWHTVLRSTTDVCGSCGAQICTFLHTHLIPPPLSPHLSPPPLISASPRNVDYQQVLNDLQAVKGVKRAHGLHIWSLTMDRVALSVHLVIGMCWRGGFLCICAGGVASGGYVGGGSLYVYMCWRGGFMCICAGGVDSCAYVLEGGVHVHMCWRG